MTKVAIFASGSGSNFENIVSKVDKGHLNNIEITSLYTNMSLKKLKDLSDKREDHYFYYMEALDYKVADEIEIDAIYEKDIKLIEEKFPNSTLDLENITEIIQNIPEEELLELISKYK